jgi:DNA-binding PadR family transcriptional regulator
MHPYEMSVMMRHRGTDENIKSSHGSIYTVVEALERDGLLDAQETSREGRRPERTVYSITPAGSELFQDWLRDLLANPSREYPEFTAALSMAAHIRKPEIIEILEDRLDQMAERLKADKNARGQLAGVLPRIFMIESEYDEAIRQSEISWLRRTIDEIRAGGYPWPNIVEGQLTWDGDETFQIPDIPIEEWAERAKAKEAEAKAANLRRSKK